MRLQILRRQFATGSQPTVPLQSFDQLLADSHKRLAQFVQPEQLDVLATKLARERQRAQETHNVVLFLCGHNAGRSQMSAAWFNRQVGLRKNYRPVLAPLGLSAGSNPAAKLNPMAVQAMEQIGVDIRDAFPKPWTPEVIKASTLVVTMGCGDTCPVAPGTVVRDWLLPDPHGRGLEEVCQVRDRILELVDDLVEEFYPETS